LLGDNKKYLKYRNVTSSGSAIILRKSCNVNRLKLIPSLLIRQYFSLREGAPRCRIQRTEYVIENNRVRRKRTLSAAETGPTGIATAAATAGLSVILVWRRWPVLFASSKVSMRSRSREDWSGGSDPGLHCRDPGIGAAGEQTGRVEIIGASGDAARDRHDVVRSW